MMALRVCEGAVSSEQRRISGSSAAAVRSAGAASMAAAEATNLRRDNDGCILVLRLLRCSDKYDSENEADAGQNEQRVDDEFELSVRQSLEDAQSEPRAKQGRRNESQRLPVQLRRGRGWRPHQIDRNQRDRLHAEDEGLIHAALTRLVPPLQAAPDGDGCAGKTCEPAGETAKKARAGVRQWSHPEQPARPAQQQIAAIGDQ